MNEVVSKQAAQAAMTRLFDTFCRLDDGRNAKATESDIELVRSFIERSDDEEESVAEQAYWEVAEMIEPFTDREGRPGALPASVVESVGILMDEWRSREAKAWAVEYPDGNIELSLSEDEIKNKTKQPGAVMLALAEIKHPARLRK